MLLFLERCLPLRASDVAFGSDVHYVSDVTPNGVVGKHHITLRHRRNLSILSNISNPITKRLLQIKSAEAVRVLAQIYTKHSMHKAKRILFLSSKLLLKKQVKQVIGLNFYIERTISMTNSIKLCRINARQFVLC